MPRERLEAMFLGDPDSIAEQAQAFADIGIEGLTITLPDTYDLETIALAGKRAERGASPDADGRVGGLALR